MPAPISAGVLGMQRTMRRWPPSQRDSASSANAGGDADDQLLLANRKAMRARGAHVLRLHREHQNVGSACVAASGAVATCARHSARGEPLARRRAQLDHRNRARVVALGDQAADQRARHVAAAEEGDLHAAALLVLARAEDRGADAHHRRAFGDRRSRSSDMPIDSVSKPNCALAACRKAASSSRKSRARRAGLGNRHQPAQPQARQARDRLPASVGRLRSAATPLLVASPEMFTWISTLSGGRCGGPLLGQAACNFFTVDRLHPVEALGSEARLVALERADQVPFQRPAATSIFCKRLLHVVLAEGALARRRAPRRCARPDGSWTLPASHRAGSRPAARAARAMRAFTACRFSRIVAIML